MYALIDNYDSFTYNLFHLMGELGAKVVVHRNDAISVDALLASRPDGIVLSPGPSDPDHAGICLETVRRAAGVVPILGVCLGHQTIGQAFGGKVVRAPRPMHGKVDSVAHEQRGLFAGVPTPFSATRYHSLCVAAEGFPAALTVTARSADGVVMGIEHRDLPISGVQFHPESIASEHGQALMRNFIAQCESWSRRNAGGAR
ncbi:MAG: aminodeoxychorismate/anthranilate synthase component II [Alphaproteobacteria bacterium]|nr:aminodeoxychorismate/anthranilate synthase component II [Alphaproteobacteria bacterium]